MAKSCYYVLVLSDGKGKFVTKINNATKWAKWETEEAPLKFSKSMAEDLAYCLNLNFYPAFVVKSFYEIEEQYFAK